MATTFAQHPQPLQSPTYIHSQPQYGNSTTPPSNNVSPSNRAAYMHAKQVRQPKQPLYIPAVLRPTELPGSRQASLTPPRSAHSSMDMSRDGFKFTTGPASLASPPLSPDEDDSRSYGPWGPGSISRVVSDEWNENNMGAVTGAPTRNHWKPDNSASLCKSSTCARPFSILNRRHHCRRCGDIFCASHSPHAIPLDQEARFHSEGTLQRACDNCWTDYRAWRAARPSRNNSVTSRDSNDTVFTQPVGVPSQNKGSEEHQPVGSVAQSVGGNWNWSTF
ncbi:unnamed protein product [Aureobasidium pullulans]|uniref:FYVE-type domain-containing protein n=1 Tax=Aureobasidium pullulans TaxID=5580 RepID=A0A4S9UJA3_AURPU|nr:hypothetical protein D6D27_07465 [Aureobasidium pullulans]THX91359.1 hypothetical protein D6D08_03195 [Aureobasidium pullulans]THZ37787.1 hypothetical protein D6C90_06602 [Aureobasidium pullulans]TIA51315.1 hypothetical protein D6C79_02609 [Aureobasidium pullulans]CAD0021332.1 unnamed protein product [Aureobasidium pullulans]